MLIKITQTGEVADYDSMTAAQLIASGEAEHAPERPAPKKAATKKPVEEATK